MDRRAVPKLIGEELARGLVPRLDGIEGSDSAGGAVAGIQHRRVGEHDGRGTRTALEHLPVPVLAEPAEQVGIIGVATADGLRRFAIGGQELPEFGLAAQEALALSLPPQL